MHMNQKLLKKVQHTLQLANEIHALKMFTQTLGKEDQLKGLLYSAKLKNP